MRSSNDIRNHARHHIGLILASFVLIGLVTFVIGPARLGSAQTVDAGWSYTGNLNTARGFGHTATLLSNGKVLVVGGFNNEPGVLKSAELYDPGTGAWSNTGNLNTGRIHHTATLLQNGKVLVAGGSDGCGEFDSAELYDPATGTWSYTGYLNLVRAGHTATLLQNGKVLVAGGTHVCGDGTNSTAELYDPTTGTWSNTANLVTGRSSHTATLLPNSKVMVAGGYLHINGNGTLNSAELYDPAAGTWNKTGDLNTARFSHKATLLPNGEVLVAGGSDGNHSDSAELYVPATGMWILISSPNGGAPGTATLLANGRVLVAGAFNDHGVLDTAELYDPTAGTWSMTASLNTGRGGHTATLLASGKVLVLGGFDINSNALNTAELYDPAINTNQIDNVEFFITQQYRDFFGREPDTIGFQNWTDTLTKCANGGYGEFDNPSCDRVHVSAGFFQSNEFQGRGYWILRFGFVGLNRSIGATRSSMTYAEFLPALQQIGGSNSPAQEEAAKAAYTNAFVQRADFQAMFPAGLSNSAYVNGLESNAGVTLPNKQALIDGLNNMSMTRAHVLRNVVESQVVFDRFLIPSFVTMEYFGYLRRDVDEVGYRNWVETLTADPSNYRHMIFGFIYSTEYRSRFGSP